MGAPCEGHLALTCALAALHYLEGQSTGIVQQFVSSFFIPILCSRHLLSADAYLHVRASCECLSNFIKHPNMFGIPGHSRTTNHTVLNWLSHHITHFQVASGLVSILSGCGIGPGKEHVMALLDRVTESLRQTRMSDSTLPSSGAAEITKTQAVINVASAASDPPGPTPRLLPLHVCCCLVPCILPSLDGSTLRQAILTLRPMALGLLLNGDETTGKAALKSLLPSVMSSARKLGGLASVLFY